MPTKGLNWIHRRAGETDIYFLANPQHRPVDALCTFRITGRSPEFWNPETGVKLQPAVFVANKETTVVPIHFSPAGSVFVVFREPINQAVQVVTIKRDGVSLFGPDTTVPALLPELCCNSAGAQLQTTVPGHYELTFADGRTQAVNVPPGLAEIAVQGPWQVRFQAGRGAPDTVEFPKLVDWASHTNDGIRYFSGTASYAATFDCAPTVQNVRYQLDLGRVEVLAEVSLNGKNLGVLWKPPFVVEVTDVLKSGRNDLLVKVTNLWSNRLIGDERYPDDCTPDRTWKTGPLRAWPSWFLQGQPRPESRRLTFTTWKYYTKDTPLLASGLLGPVRLVPLAKADLNSTN
jgi:hypothetical protein